MHSYSHNFFLDSSGGFTRLRVFSGNDTATYALCPDGKCPALPKGTASLRIPLRRVIGLASIHLGFLESLDQRSLLVGADQWEFVFDSTLRDMGKRGQWRAVGSGSNLNWELAASLRPDAIFISGLPEGDARLQAKARTLGIPVLISAEWLENHPLGRAEWIKVYGALCGRASAADSIFAKISRSYDSLRAAVSSKKTSRPSAFGGAGWRGAWHVAGGSSYMAQLLRDAGIHYAWDDDKHTGSLTLGFEAVLARARDSELWLNPGSARSVSELEGIEPRATAFRAFRSGHVYQNDVRANPEGGNDYWESGPTRPDLILKDLIDIAEGKLEQKPGNYFRKLSLTPQPPLHR